jgi:hypothetical protein
MQVEAFFDPPDARRSVSASFLSTAYLPVLDLLSGAGPFFPRPLLLVPLSSSRVPASDSPAVEIKPRRSSRRAETRCSSTCGSSGVDQWRGWGGDRPHVRRLSASTTRTSSSSVRHRREVGRRIAHRDRPPPAHSASSATPMATAAVGRGKDRR